MAETGFIDLMAFARGAELANQANWRDTFNELNQRTQESNLARQEQLFNTQFPAIQAQSGLAAGTALDATDALAANREVAQFTADTLQQMAALPPEQRAAAVAERLQGRVQGASPRMTAALLTFGRNQALQAAQRGDTAGAMAILNSLPGQSAAGQVQAQAMWNDPAVYRDPVNIAAAGGKPLPDGRVEYAGTQMLPEQFAVLMRSRGMNATFGTPEYLAPLATRQQQLQSRLDVGQQLQGAYSGIGMRFFQDPMTGQAFVVPEPPVSPVYSERATAARYPAPAAPMVSTPPAVLAAPAAPTTPAAPPVPRASFAQPQQQWDLALLNMLSQAPRYTPRTFTPMAPPTLPAAASAPPLWLTQGR